jgi:hypothetical protein
MLSEAFSDFASIEGKELLRLPDYVSVKLKPFTKPAKNKRGAMQETAMHGLKVQNCLET